MYWSLCLSVCVLVCWHIMCVREIHWHDRSPPLGRVDFGFFSKIKFAQAVLGAKKSEKNHGANFFDLIPAVFGAFNILSSTHPINSKKYDFIQFSRYQKNKDTNGFLSSRRLIWAFVELNWTKNKEVTALWNLSLFAFRQKIATFFETGSSWLF